MVATFDTSALLAAGNERDPDSSRVRVALKSIDGPLIVPAAILSEFSYFLERGYRFKALDTFLGDLESGELQLDCGERDVPRIRELLHRYADLSLGLADAAVIACAERRGGRVLTLDLRHFGVVAREGTITVLP